jgi:hypothetical protein
MTNEFFLYPVSDTAARRVPFPSNLPLEARAAYMANPPAGVLAEAAVVPFASAPTSQDAPVANIPATVEDAPPLLED